MVPMFPPPQGQIQSNLPQRQVFYSSSFVHGSIAPTATTSNSIQAPARFSHQLLGAQTFHPPVPSNLYLAQVTLNPAVYSPMPFYQQQQLQQPQPPYPSADARQNVGAPSLQPRPPSYPNPNMSLQPPSVVSGAAQRSGPNELPQSWQADVYAPAFVPSFYMGINTMPAVPVRSTPPPSIDYPTYIASFAGTSFLSALPPDPPLNSSTVREGQSLTPVMYSRYFSDLLSRELSAQHESMSQYNMYNVPLYPLDLTKYVFKLMVPGIREDCPMVMVGDMVHLRQIKTHGYNIYPPAGFTGLQYEAYIYGIDRQAGFLVLRVDGLILESGLFNISFLAQEKLLGPHARAVRDMGQLLGNTLESNDKTARDFKAKQSSSSAQPTPSHGPSTLPSSYARRMLFPEKSDGILQTSLSKGMFNHRWFDTELNFEQQKAVDAVIEQNYGAVPYLISGPPGTGKTKTIVEAALQLIFAPAIRRHHIILCAPSNQAADTLTQRLIRHLAPRVLFRMNSSSRTFAEVPSELLTYCFVQNDCFGLPEWRKLMAYRVIVTTCRDCSMLVEARCTNRDLARWERVVNAGLKGDDLPGLIDGMDVGEWAAAASVIQDDLKLHWSALLIDEAAQGTEPDILIPLSVVTPPEECSQETPMFVMAGDQRQLGPRTASRLTPLETSLFERLFSRPLYSEHPLSRQEIAKLGGGNAPEWVTRATAMLLPYIRPPFTNLIRNYRSHSAILSVPSALFYHDTLVPEATDINGLESWDGWKGRKWPVLFMANGGQDELHEEGASFYNLREIQMACKAAQSFVNSGLLQPQEIAIMSPFMEQVRRIRTNLRSPGYLLGRVNVGPLEAYQGSEHKLVILCTTRSRERFLEQDLQKGLGIIFESKKFNVAMTRAKQGLIVIGNPWLLQKDPFWLAFLSFCWRNGAIKADPQEALANLNCDSRGSTAVGSPNMGAFGGQGNSSNAGSAWSKESPSGFNPTGSGLDNVNSWRPSQDEQDLPQYLSRLEQGLLLKRKLAGYDGYVPCPLSGGFDEDDPMWTAGIAAEEALRGVELDIINPI